MVNASGQPMTFVLQVSERPWRVVVDTSRQPPGDIEIDRPPLLERPSYVLAGHSVVVLVSA
jgi:hypothetical protein